MQIKLYDYSLKPYKLSPNLQSVINNSSSSI